MNPDEIAAYYDGHRDALIRYSWDDHGTLVVGRTGLVRLDVALAEADAAEARALAALPAGAA